MLHFFVSGSSVLGFFPRAEYWNGSVSFFRASLLSGIKPESLAFNAGRLLTSWATREAKWREVSGISERRRMREIPEKWWGQRIVRWRESVREREWEGILREGRWAGIQKEVRREFRVREAGGERREWKGLRREEFRRKVWEILSNLECVGRVREGRWEENSEKMRVRRNTERRKEREEFWTRESVWGNSEWRLKEF